MTQAEKFIGEMLALRRRDFYAGKEKEFFQDQRLLLKAITCPANYLKEHGVAAPASKYRAILDTVISTMKRHGRPAKALRFSAYFLYCVQEHMKHHGEEYYGQAKTIRDALPGALRSLEKLQVEARDETETLLAVRRTLRSKGGRKKASDYIRYGTLDLFGEGSAEAQPVSSLG